MDDEIDSYSEMSGHGYRSSSGFPENSYEPDDSDTVYLESWAEVAERAAEMKRNAEEFQKRVKEPELAGKI